MDGVGTMMVAVGVAAVMMVWVTPAQEHAEEKRDEMALPEEHAV